jgi:hypothetical protein
MRWTGFAIWGFRVDSAIVFLVGKLLFLAVRMRLEKSVHLLDSLVSAIGHS